jgi:hypothetical protein
MTALVIRRLRLGWRIDDMSPALHHGKLAGFTDSFRSGHHRRVLHLTVPFHAARRSAPLAARVVKGAEYEGRGNLLRRASPGSGGFVNAPDVS